MLEGGFLRNGCRRTCRLYIIPVRAAAVFVTCFSGNLNFSRFVVLALCEGRERGNGCNKFRWLRR